MITLTSDFGTPYPAAMKGVLLSRTSAQLVDIAHDLPRQDPRAAAFWLRETVPYFPPAVHLAVVDPGVGTDRRAIVIRVGEHALVGPDNGLLRPVGRRLAESVPADSEEPPVACFEINVDDPASTTFHGRDVFAPAAAEIHEHGIDRLERLELLSPTRLDSCVDLQFPTPTVDGETVRGEVLVVDDFGNVITNIPGDRLAGLDDVSVDGEPIPVVETFGLVPPGERLLTVGSHGFVECDVNQGRGDRRFGLSVGDAVTLRLNAD